MRGPVPEKTREEALAELLRAALAERFGRGDALWVTKAEKALANKEGR